MRVPLSWLLEYAAIGSGGVDGADVDSVDADEVARRLTACGLEVESVERVGHDITGVVVAEVLEVEELTGFKQADPVLPGRHRRRPGAARHLRRDQLLGRRPGAAGAAGRRAARRLRDRRPQDLRPDVRGDDLLARPSWPSATITRASWCCRRRAAGRRLRRATAGLRDIVLDVNVTPDKGYALSVRGVARELAISYGVAYTDPADAGPARRT